MAVNLLELAKRSDETFLEINCSFGPIRVYHVPDAVLLSASVNRPEPEQPMILMKTATGTQERPSKKGDSVYDEWLADKADYDAELFAMRNATATVMALKDIDYSNVDLANPPTELANNVYNGNWPENEILRKKIWLDFTVLARRDDQQKILNALNEMNGQNEPSAEMVEEVKKNSA